ncbi:MAG TPA: TonB family protein [Gemmatimonadales bacterium]|nr:TonB family protein [Gemmatimonadales bacterium]
MFGTFMESSYRGLPRHLVPSGTAALLAHLALGGAALWATLQPASFMGAERLPMIIAWPRESEAHPPRRGADGIQAPPEITMVDVPGQLPIGVPPIELSGALDPQPWLWLGTTQAATGGSMAVAHPGGVWSWALVEEPPTLLSAPPPRYPEALRRAGVVGRVVVQVVVDTLGRAEPSSVAVVESSHSGFDAAAREYVYHALFRPARVHGGAVRVLVRVPIDFVLRTAH